MNVLLKPFIAVYHGVQAIGRLPKKLFHKTEDIKEKAENKKALQQNTVPNEPKKKKKSLFSKKEKKKESSEPENLVDEFAASGIQKRSEDAPDRPMIRYRYVVINAMGKKENGTFEAESEIGRAHGVTT